MQIPGYRLIRQLNSGAMADVYLAVQLSLGREVALKIMKPALDADPEFHQRFQREARIVGQLSHPNIIPIYDIGRHQGLNYIAMEYLPGGSLDQKLAEGLTPEQSSAVIVAIASALALAHRKGYVHRDIKPENILFRSTDFPVLTDFGIASSAQPQAQMTQAGTVLGTPYYMSPEQARGDTTDGRADLYSLGVVLYELLTGSRPFKADSSIALCLQHLQAPPPPLPRHLARYQPLLDRLLAKAPEQRYQSADELVAAMQQLQQASPGNARTSWPNQALQQLKRRTAKHQEVSQAKATQVRAPTTPQESSSPATGPATAIYRKPAWLAAAALLVAVMLVLLWPSGATPPSPGKARFTLQPQPGDARVRLLNIRDNYYPGIELSPGRYYVEIDHPDYYRQREWMDLREGDNGPKRQLIARDSSAPSQLPEMALIRAGQLNLPDGRVLNMARDFYLSRYEITFDEYDDFALASNRPLPDDEGKGRGRRPVFNLSWEDARAYADWLSAHSQRRYRLPSADEWEYAARNPDGSPAPWQADESALRRANCRFGCQPWWSSLWGADVQPVGRFAPNRRELFDTAGNLDEWVADCAQAGANPLDCRERQVRGGSYRDNASAIGAQAHKGRDSQRPHRDVGVRLLLEQEERPNPVTTQADEQHQPPDKTRDNPVRRLMDRIFR